jgi:hypothetical protein
MATLLNWLNLALVANIFLVLLSFLWLVVATIGELNHVPLGLKLWYQLWQPVFTPAIGILMAGALVTGALSWINKRFNLNPTNHP